jgi:threonine dehydratase
MPDGGQPRLVSLADVRAAASRIEGRILRTPTVGSEAVSRAAGCDVLLKLDNLQAVGSFKERGAANKLAQLTDTERSRGVVAMSAGNHAQGVARHASLLGIDAVIVMPLATPVSKITRTRAWGARVVMHGETLAEATAHALSLAERDGLVFVHPFDDPAIMAGQGTMALEVIEDCGPVDAIVVPIGGGGLIGGCAAVISELCPDAEIIGVQVAGYDSLGLHPGLETIPLGGATIAEGIAVGTVGRAPLAMIRAHVDAVLTVPERVIEDAIALLAEGAKQVSEGAGAAALAGVLANPERFAGKRVVVPVCGANIDSRILANVLLRNLLRDGRLLRLRMEIPDRPGVLADIATLIGGSGGNIIEVSHQRLFASPSVQNAELEVMVEARDPVHATEITTALSARYVVRRG